MPTLNPCPPSDEEYCLNGGECLYLLEAPTTYVCSCFMPFYGTRCEHKAIIGGPDEGNLKNKTEWAIKKSVDRAMTVTALIFIVCTFFTVILLAWYLSRLRRLDYAQWKEGHQVNASKTSVQKATTECGVQVNLYRIHNNENKSLALSLQSASTNQLSTVVSGDLPTNFQEEGEEPDTERVLPRTCQDNDMLPDLQLVRNNGQNWPASHPRSGPACKLTHSLGSNPIENEYKGTSELICSPTPYVNATELFDMFADDHEAHKGSNAYSPTAFCHERHRNEPRIRKQPIPLPKEAFEKAVGAGSTLPPEGKVHRNMSSSDHWLKQTFTVASQHDALLSDLLNRGNKPMHKQQYY